MTCVGTIGEVMRSGGEKYDTFFWNIRSFSSLTEEADKCYHSPEFLFKGCQSYLSFYPNGRSPHSVGYFTLYFFNGYGLFSNRTLQLKLGFKTRSGCIEKWFSRNIVTTRFTGLGLEDVIHRSDFLRRKLELAPSDCLTFVLLVSTTAPKIIKDYLNASVQTEPKCEENKAGQKVVEAIGNLLASGDKSDAVIHVEDTEFKVHSCILAARTPVFSALFEHETVEKTSRKITIKDCDPTVFKEFLNHIYTGRIQNLTTETAFSIYRIADKYLVTDLKELCKKHIQDTLCVDSFCGAIELALRYGEQGLLQCAIDYFVKNIHLIVKSVEWQRYIEENPREANEILVKAFSSP